MKRVGRRAPARTAMHLVAALVLALGIVGLAASSLRAAEPDGPHAAVVKLEGPIHNRSAAFLSRAIDKATEDGALFVVVLLDTPGGLYDSTRDMVEKVLTAQVPVVVYVWPPGAQAASAGTFVLAAGHVAAMAPTTNVGAASPVGSSGEDLPDTLKSKATQDAAAFLRSIAEERDRNAAALEATVLEATAYTASEALERDVVDLVAKDITDLMAKLDGRTVELPTGETTLETDGIALVDIGKNPLEHFLGVLANPNVALLFVTLGAIGIIIELFNLGILIPGILGAIFLALGIVGMSNLPVNWIGLGLLGFSVLLLFLELQAPGLGMFGIGAVISFVVGGFFLFGGISAPPVPAPSFRVSVWFLGTVAVLLAAALVLFLRYARDSRKAAGYVSVVGGLVGQGGTVVTALAPSGTVRVGGEVWTAVSEDTKPIAEGAEVVVREVNGVTLKVVKAQGNEKKEEVRR